MYAIAIHGGAGALPRTQFSDSREEAYRQGLALALAAGQRLLERGDCALNAVEAAVTDPVDASGVMTRASFETQAYVPDPLIQVVHPTPIRVTVIMEHSGDEKK